VIVPIEIHVFCAVCLEELDSTVVDGEVAVQPCAYCAAREMVAEMEDSGHG